MATESKFGKNFGETTVDDKISINSAKQIYERNIINADEKLELFYKLYHYCIDYHPGEGLDSAIINYCKTKVNYCDAKNPGIILALKREEFNKWLKDVRDN